MTRRKSNFWTKQRKDIPGIRIYGSLAILVIATLALGIVYLDLKQFRKAEEILVESLRIKETHNTRIALALAYLAQGKSPKRKTPTLMGSGCGLREAKDTAGNR